PSSLGYIENDNPRMVDTPWFPEPVPFNMAAEIGTKKVITEHSTIGLVITTDGSIGEIPREEYKEAEMRVIEELRGVNKPFVVLLNSTAPESEETRRLAAALSEEYAVSVVPVNCLKLTEDDINEILGKILWEFPTNKIKIELPSFLAALESNHPANREIIEAVGEIMGSIGKIRDIKSLCEALSRVENVKRAEISGVDLGRGEATVSVELCRELFYKVLSDKSKLKIEDDRELLDFLSEMKMIKTRYEKIKNALDEVEATGYGIVMPDIEELSLEEPEIMKQQGRYGVRLRASAPSIHMMKANITTEVSPIVGTEKQSEDLIMYLLSEFDDNPEKIWESNIFGKSLHELVNEGLHTKLSRMPTDARMRIQETIERVINEGCNGLVCIII
ncbi:MAG: stage IV sporulation protein A, partial [Clostridia bacterium]|nr:stage IV sporulation protein A [Clostridia bacterium]